jgi:predicted nucleic acid-binding protein
MRDKIFLDTNIFVYAIDASPETTPKRDIARVLIREHIENESGVISIQVVQEFYQVATGRIVAPISTEDALEFIHYISILDIVAANLEMVLAAIHLHRKHSFSFWDALILQAAKSAGCSQVLSEDLQHGFRLDGLIVKNPFHT